MMFIKHLPIKFLLLMAFAVLANLIANYQQLEIDGRVLVLSIAFVVVVFWHYWRKYRKGDS